MRCGLTALLGKTQRACPEHRLALLCRDYLADTLRQRPALPVNDLPAGQGMLFLNGRPQVSRIIPDDGPEEVGLCKGTIVYARLEARTAAAIASRSSVESALARVLIHALSSASAATC